jgi:hypothetical protein
LAEVGTELATHANAALPALTMMHLQQGFANSLFDLLDQSKAYRGVLNRVTPLSEMPEQLRDKVCSKAWLPKQPFTQNGALMGPSGPRCIGKNCHLPSEEDFNNMPLWFRQKLGGNSYWTSSGSRLPGETGGDAGVYVQISKDGDLTFVWDPNARRFFGSDAKHYIIGLPNYVIQR